MMNRKNNLLLFINALFIAVSSCKPPQTTMLANAEMEGTVRKGSEVRFETFKKGTLQPHDIVLFDANWKEEDFVSTKFLRIVGMPGDKFQIDSGNIFVNGRLSSLPTSSKFSFYVRFKDAPSSSVLTKYFNRQATKFEYYFFLDESEAIRVKQFPEVDSFSRLISEKNFVEEEIIGDSKFIGRNSYFLGPLYIPKIGDFITSEVLRLIPNYLTEADLGKTITDHYFYLVGDNRFFAMDSRYLGLVPEKSIKGRMVSVSTK